MRAVGAPAHQTDESRGGRSSVEGTKEVIAASGFAWCEEDSGGVWKIDIRAGGAALPTQQAAQAGHLSCEETLVLEPCSPQCAAPSCASA